MPEHLKFILHTVRNPGPPQQARCPCCSFWSVAQQHAMLQLYPRIKLRRPRMIDLSRETPTIISPDPLPDPDWPVPRYKNEQGQWTDIEPYLRAEYVGQVVRYAMRAERIAGGYARLYLESAPRAGLRPARPPWGSRKLGAALRFLVTDQHGAPTRRGRFYWAGLAAFASKQVAFTIRNWALPFFGPATLSALGKGNLWLYNDALPWHYAWTVCPESVEMCAAERNAQDFEPVVLSNLGKQEWAGEAVPNIPWNFDENSATLGAPIGQLRLAPLMREAIDGWKAFEAETSDKGKAALAMQHLWAMARHEQGEVLQGLIYGNPKVQKELERARKMGMPMNSKGTPLTFRMQLSFSASEFVEDPEWRSDAPPGIRLFDYRERMEWISDTADQYHKLMCGRCQSRMLDELRILGNRYA